MTPAVKQVLDKNAHKFLRYYYNGTNDAFTALDVNGNDVISMKDLDHLVAGDASLSWKELMNAHSTANANALVENVHYQRGFMTGFIKIVGRETLTREYMEIVHTVAKRLHSGQGTDLSRADFVRYIDSKTVSIPTETTPVSLTLNASIRRQVSARQYGDLWRKIAELQKTCADLKIALEKVTNEF